MLTGEQVYRVHWVLGTDLLLGECHCGARHQAEDPVELWEWLLAHPDGHESPHSGPGPGSWERRPIEPEPGRPQPAGVG